MKEEQERVCIPEPKTVDHPMVYYTIALPESLFHKLYEYQISHKPLRLMDNVIIDLLEQALTPKEKKE